MHFTGFIILILLLKGEVPENDVDAVLLQQVEDTYGQCLRIVDAAGELDEDLYENRRRAEDVAFNANSKLKLCAAMVKKAQAFDKNYIAMTRVLSVLQSWEIFFIKDLLKQAGKKMGDALYIASVDGDTSSKFHSLCDGQGPTVVVVETTAGVIFGGYTHISWSSKAGYHKSTTSFLFQIRPSMIKFGFKTNSQYGVYHLSSYGPTFGGGHDLRIASGALSNKNSVTYQNTYGMQSSHQLNNGQVKFQVKDYIVLKAAPL